MFDPVVADIRFGVGLSPKVAGYASVADMLARLEGPDDSAARYPIPPFSQATPSPRDYQALSHELRAARGTDAEEDVRARQQVMREAGREARADNLGATLARSITTGDGLRERLSRFWADHFTVRATRGVVRHLVSPYVEEAIRPHVTGRFADMLKAVVVQPMMLLFLDQHLSMGPNSVAAGRRNRGLNENLAREVMELHTLGVDGAYDQDDVRQLAELLTGLTYSPRTGFYFNPDYAEPGPETVLGQSFGGNLGTLDDVMEVMDALARHPDTARHIGRKMAVHFVSDTPPEDLVAALAQTFQATDGDLMAVTATLLGHPAAWGPELTKAKTPIDFVTSAVRALGVDADMIAGFDQREMRRHFMRALTVMGQTWESPLGPDGWPEEAEAWITPQGMAGRITWAMTAPEGLIEPLPDPRDFVHHALGPQPSEAVLFAARAAESVADGVGIILASAAFQRR